MFLHGALHAYGGAGGGAAIGFGRHGGIGHIAHGLRPQLCQAGLAQPGQRHVGIGHDGCALLQRRHTGLHRTGRERQIIGIVKIRAGVYGAQHHGAVFGRDLYALLCQLGGNDLHACPLNARRGRMFQFQYSTPSLAAMPFS